MTTFFFTTALCSACGS